MPDRSGCQAEAPLLHCAHQVDAAARGIILIPRFEVGGTGGEAEAAVNAGQRFIMIEKAWFGHGILASKLRKNSFRVEHLFHSLVQGGSNNALFRVQTAMIKDNAISCPRHESFRLPERQFRSHPRREHRDLAWLVSQSPKLPLIGESARGPISHFPRLLSLPVHFFGA